MAIERVWKHQPPIAFIADGGANGVVTVNSVECLKVKQIVTVSAIGLPDLNLEVKRVLSFTQLIVGPKGKNLLAKTDLSAYTMAQSSSISATEQAKTAVPPKDINQAVYEREPTVAIRTISVDKVGDHYSLDNPFPVQLSDGSIEIGTVNAELEVQLSHIDDFPDLGDVADSVQIGDGTDVLEINSDGSINVNIISGSGSDIKYKEFGAITDETETTVGTFTSTIADSKIMRIIGDSHTFGTWKVYNNSISNANLSRMYRTSPMNRNCDIKFEREEKLPTIGDKLIITFQADRYRSNLLGVSSDTFVNVIGFTP